MTGNEPAVSWGNLKTAAADAIQSLDRNQNTDANFDNLFKINGSGTVIIKNTTNGDVTLKISNINAWTAENTYLAVWELKTVVLLGVSFCDNTRYSICWCW